MQEKVAQALADGGAGRVVLPDNFAQLCMAYAFLGNKDSAPMSKVTIFPIAKDVKQCDFWAPRVDGGKALWRVEGKTDSFGKVVEKADRGLHHEVKLTWEGYIELDGKRITRLLLAARGTEKLKWGSEALKARAKTDDEVAFLTAGRFIDMECGVRYGIIGEPVPIKKARDGK